MAGKNDNFDALMAMMALKHIMDDTKDIEIHPFTCEMSEQTIKLTDLMKKKFGFDTVKVKPNSEDGFADFLKNLFGGGYRR